METTMVIFAGFISRVLTWLQKNTSLDYRSVLPVFDPVQEWTCAVVVCGSAGWRGWRFEVINYHRSGSDITNVGMVEIGNSHGWDETGCDRFITDLHNEIKANHPEWLKDSTSEALTRSEAPEEEKDCRNG